MRRKTASILLNSKIKPLLISLPLLAIPAVSCGDNEKDDEPENPHPEATVVGKWQKYQRVEDDGSLSSGDPDEFWIFEKDDKFAVEDGGSITDIGTYDINGKTLIITYQSVDEPEYTETLRGIYEIKDGYMNYQYTVVGEDDYVEYRFRKV